MAKAKPTAKAKKTSNEDKFVEMIKQGYQFASDSIVLGTAILDGKPLPNTPINACLSTLNRHGLIAGATGTGKTRTLQKMAEALSSKGVPVLIMDIKGDVSGLSQPGTNNPKIESRQQLIGIPWQPEKSPVEFLTISNEKGVRLRATISEFGPILFSRLLEINNTQAGVVALVFKYCDDKKLPLLDLKDFKSTLQYLSNEGKDEIKKDYGAISSASVGAIMRKVIELEQQGAELFFGETAFNVEDLCRTDVNGRGYINVLRLIDIQNRPKLFSTFMLCLLAEVYEKFPEVGDIDKPKLVIFIDEAHLIFDQASKTLLDQIEMVVRLIRSKGVGIYFCTQSPMDVPNVILGQLGMKIQHSLRAFTAKDRKAIKLAAENYPHSEFYDTEDLLTSLGMGEALITVLNEKGAPTPLAHTLMCAPESRMGTVTDAEIMQVVSASTLVDKYKDTIDRESAAEMLAKKLNQAAADSKSVDTQVKLPDIEPAPKSSGKRQKSAIEQIATSPLAKQVGRTLTREITRGLFGVLGIKTRR